MTERTMRAKLQVSSVNHNIGVNGETTGETVKFHGVAAKSYGADGLDEDNTFAKWSPSANFDIYIANPALFGKLLPGQKYYVDFTSAE